MTAHGRRATGWAALVASLGALAVAAVLFLQPVHTPADAGILSLPYQQSSAPQRRSPPPSTGPPAVDALWTPTRVVIAELSVDAPIRAAGVAGDGTLQVPADPRQLGWWIGSALPGAPRGTVVLAGHVDTARDGRGALYRLEHLPIGSRIDVRAGDAAVAYRVTARRSYPKSRLPDALFRRDTPPRLALITCGGAFRNGAYDHNVVVYAEPMTTA